MKQDKPMMHYTLKSNPPKLDIHETDDGGAIYEITNKILAKIIDAQEEAIVDAVIQAAIEEGISDLFILDKKFVLDALKEKLERDRV